MSGERAAASGGRQSPRDDAGAGAGDGPDAAGAARIDLELIGADGLAGAPARAEIDSLCAAAAASAGVHAGHLAVEFVDAERIAQLNASHRGKAGPTDVLSFPIDGTDPVGGAERELGDVVICPQHTVDLREAIVHGVLHLVGMDHETDSGEMLAIQAQILAQTPGVRE